MNITLPRDLDEFVRQRVRTRASHTASEAIVEALYLLRDQDDLRRTRLERLRKDIAIGIAECDRGEAREVSLEEIKAKARARLARLRAKIAVGVEQANRGEVGPLDIETTIARARARLRAKRRTRSSSR